MCRALYWALSSEKYKKKRGGKKENRGGGRKDMVPAPEELTI